MAITAGKTQNFYMKMRNNNKIDAAYTVHMISATLKIQENNGKQHVLQWMTCIPFILKCLKFADLIIKGNI